MLLSFSPLPFSFFGDLENQIPLAFHPSFAHTTTPGPFFSYFPLFHFFFLSFFLAFFIVSIVFVLFLGGRKGRLLGCGGTYRDGKGRGKGRGRVSIYVYVMCVFFVFCFCFFLFFSVFLRDGERREVTGTRGEGIQRCRCGDLLGRVELSLEMRGPKTRTMDSGCLNFSRCSPGPDLFIIQIWVVGREKAGNPSLPSPVGAKFQH